MQESGPSPETPRKPASSSTLTIAAKALLGVGLLLALMAVTILSNESPGPAHTTDVASTAAVPSTVPDAPLTTVSLTSTTLTPLQAAQAEGGYLVVEAVTDPIKIYDKVPPGSVVSHSLPRNGYLDVLATFWAIDEAIDDQDNTWHQVYVPVRPNETKGWVKASDVSTKVLTHDVRIDLSEHRLDLYDRGTLVRSYDIGVGKGETPTPLGEYFVAIKMKTPNPDGVYGVQIMGLSGFSEKLTDWPGGGQVGIHGTNDPSTVGTDVSHGCIRLRNKDILELSNDVHLGTPVFVKD